MNDLATVKQKDFCVLQCITQLEFIIKIVELRSSKHLSH